MQRLAPLLAQVSFLLPGAFGGWVAFWIGVPLPVLIGGMAGGAVTAMWLSARGHEVTFPKQVRRPAVALIGTMIGATFTPDMMGVVPQLWVSLLAMVVFALMAHAVGFAISHGSAGMTALPRSMRRCPVG